MLFVATKASLKLPPSTKVIGFRIQFCYHAIIRLNYRKPEGSITSAQLRLLYLTVAQRCRAMGVQRRRLPRKPQPVDSLGSSMLWSGLEWCPPVTNYDRAKRHRGFLHPWKSETRQKSVLITIQKHTHTTYYPFTKEEQNYTNKTQCVPWKPGTVILVQVNLLPSSKGHSVIRINSSTCLLSLHKIWMY